MADRRTFWPPPIPIRPGWMGHPSRWRVFPWSTRYGLRRRWGTRAWWRDVYKRQAEELADGVQVVCRPRHDVAGAGGVVEVGGLAFEVGEEVVAQVELDLCLLYTSRSRLELSLSRPHCEGEGRDPGSFAEEHSRYRMEGTDPALRSLSNHDCARQEAHRRCGRARS